MEPMLGLCARQVLSWHLVCGTRGQQDSGPGVEGCGLGAVPSKSAWVGHSDLPHVALPSDQAGNEGGQGGGISGCQSGSPWVLFGHEAVTPGHIQAGELTALSGPVENSGGH